MVKKYLMFDLNDEKTKKLSEVLGSKSCKKILDFLSEEEASETDISRKINMPLNTVEYNLKKLIGSGLVNKSKDFFWSVKGKKIPIYKVSNKHIVISPKTKVPSKLMKVIPTALIGGAVALLIRHYYTLQNTFTGSTKSLVFERTPEMIADAGNAVTNMSVESAVAETIACTPAILANPWLWFLSGILFSLILYLILNWKKL